MSTQRSAHRRQISAYVDQLLRQRPVYLDVETTGTDSAAEVVELAVLDSDGTPLLNTLVRPRVPVRWEAEQVHGISDEDLAHAPELGELWPVLHKIYTSRRVLIYNSAFVLRVLGHSAKQRGIFPERMPQVDCVMLIYAEYHGVWDEAREAHEWQRLDDALRQCRLKWPPGMRPHRAAGDAEATRRLMEYMASRRKSAATTE